MYMIGASVPLWLESGNERTLGIHGQAALPINWPQVSIAGLPFPIPVNNALPAREAQSRHRKSDREPSGSR